MGSLSATAVDARTRCSVRGGVACEQLCRAGNLPESHANSSIMNRARKEPQLIQISVIINVER